MAARTALAIEWPNRRVWIRTGVQLCDSDTMPVVEPVPEVDEITDALWADYLFTAGLEARNALVVAYTPLVRYAAFKLGSRLPVWVDREDLISYGMFGLIKAVERYDPERGVKFSAYAFSRIHGSMIDELRTLDWAPRSVRAKARDIERVEQQLIIEHGRLPEDAEVALCLGITEEALRKARTATSVATISDFVESGATDGLGASIVEIHLDVTCLPEEIAQVNDLSRLIGEAVNEIGVRSRTILVLYYIEEMTLSQIGSLFGVTESRVSQLQSKALASIHEHLSLGAIVAA